MMPKSYKANSVLKCGEKSANLENWPDCLKCTVEWRIEECKKYFSENAGTYCNIVPFL